MTTDKREKLNDHKVFEDIVEKCLEATENEKGNYIFRGTSQEHVQNSNRVESSLYRHLKKPNLIQTNLDLFANEITIISRAKYLFSPNARNIEILTELRHFEEKLAIIDFTRNLFVALFFACQKTFDEQNKIIKKDGEIVVLKIPHLEKDTHYEHDFPYAIEPATNQSSSKRVLAQSSIFIHSKKGFIDREDFGIEFTPVKLEYKFKECISRCLAEYYNINLITMYRDVFGFIKNKSYIGLSNLEAGKQAFREEKYEEAIKQLNIVIKNNHESKWELHNAFITRAISRLEIKEFNKGIEDCNEAIKLLPKDSSGFFNRAIVKFMIGDSIGSLEDINKFIEIESGVKGAHLWRALVNIKLKKFKEVLADVNICVKLDFNSLEMIHMQELSHLSLKKYNNLKINNKENEYSVPQSKHGYPANRMNLPSDEILRKILEEADKEIILNPKNILAYMQKGEISFYMKNFSDAINNFDNVIKLQVLSDDSSSLCISSAYQFRGLSKSNSLDFVGAINDFDEALKTRPFNPEILSDRASAIYSIGEALESQNKIEEATKQFKIALLELDLAIMLNPNLINAFYNRQLVNYALGNYKDSRKDLVELHQLNKRHQVDNYTKTE